MVAIQHIDRDRDWFDIPVTDIRRLSAEDNDFEPYSDHDLQELALFIKAYGPRAMQPVALSPDYILVDGYARLDAAILAGLVEIPACIYAYNDRHELLHHRYVLNVKRTHLDADTQARMRARLQVLNERETRRLEASPRKADRARAKAMQALVDHGAVASIMPGRARP